MKKNLLFAAAMVASVCASAQSYVVADAEKMGLTSEVAPVTAGTLVGETADFKVSIAFDDSYKANSASANDFTAFVIDGTEIAGSYGIQGNSNPKDINNASPDGSLLAPATGAVFQIDALADGYVYVLGKMSSNKSYTVFEEGSAIPYTFVMDSNNEALGDLFSITLNGVDVGDGIINVTEAITWPEKIYLGDGWEAAAGEAGKIGISGMGLLKFQVFKDCKYLCNAVGSKMMLCAAYFDKEGDAVVSIKNDSQTLTLIGGTEGIASNVAAADVVASAYYTVAGQEIAAPVKGINLVKQTLADGSVKTIKVIVK